MNKNVSLLSTINLHLKYYEYSAIILKHIRLRIRITSLQWNELIIGVSIVNQRIFCINLLFNNIA